MNAVSPLTKSIKGRRRQKAGSLFHDYTPGTEALRRYFFIHYSIYSLVAAVVTMTDITPGCQTEAQRSPQYALPPSATQQTDKVSDEPGAKVEPLKSHKCPSGVRGI